jgi:hypothetical protein
MRVVNFLSSKVHPVSGMCSMGRVNRGRHVIIENVTHAKLKEMCNEAGVLMTTICDTTLRVFVFDMMKMTAAERNKVLQEMAGGMAFAKAFAGFAGLIQAVKDEGVIDESGEGKNIVTPPEGKGPGQSPPQ